MPIRAPRAFLDFAHTLADLSARAILPHFRRPLAVENKGGRAGFDPVTAADRAAEQAMRKAIARAYADHGILGEEFEAVPGAGRYRWILDPIDGTRAFLAGRPEWGTLIALADQGVPVLGLMNQPFTGERVWSDGRQTRARLPNGKVRRLSTRACASLSQAVLTTTHPDLLTGPGAAAAFGRIKARARMTAYGGDCYGYCLLAAGSIDIIVESGLKAHDVAALVPIIEAAGGLITTWDGGPALGGGRILAAGDARLHKEAMALLAA
jgi:myo-inositol-1(or 4)-monophosphatase